MIFVDQNKIVPGGIFIKGKFIDPKFNSTIFQQELAQASELSNRLSFNHTDGHDGRGPMLAKMRDWWGLNARKAQSFVITYNTGDVEPMQKIPMNKQSRYIIFCTDWQPGQWWCFNDQTYTGWKIGTVLHFHFADPHGCANASEYPMSILQVSHKLERYQTKEYLENKTK